MESKYKVIKQPLTLKGRVGQVDDTFVESEFIGGNAGIAEAIEDQRCELVEGTGEPVVNVSERVKKLKEQHGKEKRKLDDEIEKLKVEKVDLENENKILKAENEEQKKTLEELTAPADEGGDK